jgi:hypothetical protein
MKVSIRIIALVVLISVPVMGYAEPQLAFSVAPSDFWAAQFQVGVEGLGAFPGLNTLVFVGGEAAYNGINYYRRPDGSPFLSGDGDFDADLISTNRFRGNWNLGIQQGILPPSREERDLLRIALKYEGYYFTTTGDVTGTYLAAADRPETAGFINNALHLELDFDDSIRDGHYVANGMDARGEIEYAPGFMNDYSDYIHASAAIRTYLPVYDASPEEPMNRFSIYLANRTRVRYLTGAYVPVEEGYSNGISVRSIENERFDAPFVASSSLDLRFALPALFIPEIMPGVLLFTDLGYYYEDSEYNGLIISHGGAIYLNLFNYLQVGARMSLLSLGSKMDESIFTPVELMVFYAF